MSFGDYTAQGGIYRLPAASLEPEYEPVGDTSILPQYQPIEGMGEYFESNVSGLGATAPRGGTAWRLASSVSPVAGALGQTADTLADQRNGVVSGLVAGATIAFIVAGLGLRLGAGYVAGKAMAPSPEKEGAFGWGGAIGSLFLGPPGIGITGLVALSQE